MHQLQPSNWQEQDPIGDGSFGIVYKASWRGNEVAVKVLKLPKRAPDMTSLAADLLKKKVEQITTDFVTEIEITCDLSHPNLVQLLGYSDKPSLLIMQELLLGGSVDHQLCAQHCPPSGLSLSFPL